MIRDAEGARRRGRSMVLGALLAAALSAIALVGVTHLWTKPLDIPFQYAHVSGDDEQDATLDLMLIKNIHEKGWYSENPKLDAPFAQRWAEWPMGGDLLAYTIKKGIVEVSGDVASTFNLFWLLTFPLTALAAFPVLRRLRCSWPASLAGAVLFALAPYHFRNGAGHENLAFYVGIPVIVFLCVRILGPDATFPRPRLRDPAWWKRLAGPIAGVALVAVTGIYYLAFLLTLLGICAVIGAVARRRPARLAVAAGLGIVGLAVWSAANLPTLLFRWSHPTNVLGVPDRAPGISEHYPLRIVELLSPVTGHRLPPFAWIADHLYMPGRTEEPTAQLGLAAAIGIVVAVAVLLVRALRSRTGESWRFEARLGIVVLATLLLGTAGGLSRALELVGLQGVRAWSRIAIVTGFAGIVVFARLLDRLRVSIARSSRRLPAWLAPGLIVVIATAGVLDQASPALMPRPESRAAQWNADQAFVDRLEHRLPADAMVFQLPVVDFPEHGAVAQMAAHDLIKEGYLHSKTLRWSAGGIRGRDGEWQWPAAELPLRQLVRGISAMGFSALTLDRAGYTDRADHEVRALTQLLGPPIARKDDRLLAWDLRPAARVLLAGTTPTERHRIAQLLLTAPRLYLSSDVDPIVGRGDTKTICATGTLQLVNPRTRPTARVLAVSFRAGKSAAKHGQLVVGRHRFELRAGNDPQDVPVVLPPGTTRATIQVSTPGLRCASATVAAMPTVAVRVRRP